MNKEKYLKEEFVGQKSFSEIDLGEPFYDDDEENGLVLDNCPEIQESEVVYPMKIDDAINTLNELKTKGANSVYFDGNCGHMEYVITGTKVELCEKVTDEPDKFLRFDTPKGTFQIPTRAIAENRANYYANHDGYTRDSQQYKDEVNYGMSNNDELIDWLCNNTDFSDFKSVIRKISEPEQDESSIWDNMENFELVKTN